MEHGFHFPVFINYVFKNRKQRFCITINYLDYFVNWRRRIKYTTVDDTKHAFCEGGI